MVAARRLRRHPFGCVGRRVSRSDSQEQHLQRHGASGSRARGSAHRRVRREGRVCGALTPRDMTAKSERVPPVGGRRARQGHARVRCDGLSLESKDSLSFRLGRMKKIWDGITRTIPRRHRTATTTLQPPPQISPPHRGRLRQRRRKRTRADRRERREETSVVISPRA